MIKNLPISILLLVCLTVGFIAFNAGCGGAPADGVIAVISESSGNLTVNSKPAKTGAELKAGDIVETGPNSYAFIKYKQDNYELMLFSSKTSG